MRGMCIRVAVVEKRNSDRTRGTFSVVQLRECFVELSRLVRRHAIRPTRVPRATRYDIDRHSHPSSERSILEFGWGALDKVVEGSSTVFSSAR